MLAELYGLITNVYKAKDIKTAEAAKVIDKPFLRKKAFSERTTIFSFSTGFLFSKKKRCVDVRGVLEEEAKRKGFYYKGL